MKAKEAKTLYLKNTQVQSKFTNQSFEI